MTSAPPAATRRTGALLAALLPLALLALGAWFAWPRPSAAPPRPALRAVLLDASASATRLRPSWNLWARRALLAEAATARARGEELLVVRYAADVERLFGPGDPAAFVALLDGHGLDGHGGAPPRLALAGAAEQGTRLAAALEVAAADVAAAGRAAGELVLLAEPSFTGPDPHPSFAGLARAGIGARLVEPPAPELANVALERLELPRNPPRGAPLALNASFLLESGTEGLARLLAHATLSVEIELATPSGVRTRSVPLVPPPVAPGAREVRWSLTLDLGPAEPGWAEVTARARLIAPGALQRGDAVPEDDARSATTRIGGTRIGVAVAPRERQAELARWLGNDPWPGIAWRWVEPRELATHLEHTDLVLTLDVPLADLPQRWLRDFVERTGGGLFVTGGWGLLRGWNGDADDPELATLLPLAPARDDDGPREVLFLVDGSGSMVGEPFDLVKNALIEMAEVAPPADRLVLRFFTGTLLPPIELSGSGARARGRALERLATLQPPGGETAIFYSVEQLVRERATSEREPGLVILLSDGLDSRAHDVDERSLAIRQALSASGMQLTVIAAGDEADVETLTRLAGGAEAFHHVRELGDLGELFQREVNRDRVREGEPTLRVADAAGVELEPAREALAALTRLARGAWPPVVRHARAELVPGAAALLVNERGEPVLAVQRVGAGLVAALVTAPLEDWAPAWGTDAAAHGVLGTVARSLLPEEREPAPRLAFVRGRLELDGAPQHWPPVVHARLEDAAGRAVSEHVLTLPAPRPSEDPRERRVDAGNAAAPVSSSGALRAVVTSGGETLATLPVAAPPAEEWDGERGLGPLEPPAPRLATTGAGAEPDPRHVPVVLAGIAALFLAALWRAVRPRRQRPAL